MNFVDFARSHGLEILNLYPSDRIIRCGTVDKPRSTNGAYFFDGKRGWVFDWSGDAKVNWFEGNGTWTLQEKTEWLSKRQTMKSDQAKSQAIVAERAEATLRSAKLDNHPYLEIKGFPDEKGLVIGEKLLIPMRDCVSNKIQGYQEILWNGEARKYEKKMLAGMRAKNAVFYMGDRGAQAKIAVEGYATALSVQAALKITGSKAAVICCFSASNMVQILGSMSGKLGIYADNDVSQTGEKAAIQTGLPYVMSDVVGHDANDDMQKFGTLFVAKKLLELNQKWMQRT